jgi:hypothetical protein
LERQNYFFLNNFELHTLQSRRFDYEYIMFSYQILKSLKLCVPVDGGFVTDADVDVCCPNEKDGQSGIAFIGCL